MRGLPSYSASAADGRNPTGLCRAGNLGVKSQTEQIGPINLDREHIRSSDHGGLKKRVGLSGFNNILAPYERWLFVFAGCLRPMAQFCDL